MFPFRSRDARFSGADTGVHRLLRTAGRRADATKISLKRNPIAGRENSEVPRDAEVHSGTMKRRHTRPSSAPADWWSFPGTGGDGDRYDPIKTASDRKSPVKKQKIERCDAIKPEKKRRAHFRRGWLRRWVMGSAPTSEGSRRGLRGCSRALLLSFGQQVESR